MSFAESGSRGRSRRDFLKLSGAAPAGLAVAGNARQRRRRAVATGSASPYDRVRLVVPDPQQVTFSVRYPGKAPLKLAGHFWANAELLENGRRCPAIVECNPYRRRDGTMIADSKMHPWFVYNTPGVSSRARSSRFGFHSISSDTRSRGAGASGSPSPRPSSRRCGTTPRARRSRSTRGVPGVFRRVRSCCRHVSLTGFTRATPVLERPHAGWRARTETTTRIWSEQARSRECVFRYTATVRAFIGGERGMDELLEQKTVDGTIRRSWI